MLLKEIGANILEVMIIKMNKQKSKKMKKEKMQELENRLLKQAMKRKDRRYIPLLSRVIELSNYYNTEYIIEKMEENYDGRKMKYKDTSIKMMKDMWRFKN